MAVNDLITVIRSVNLFEDLDDEALSFTVNLLESETFPINATIVRQGEIGNKIYLIHRGIAQVFILNKVGTELHVANLNPLDYFGEIALLLNNVRTSSVRALTRCELFSITKENFDILLKKYPILHRKINEILCKRLTQTLHLISAKIQPPVILMLCSEHSTDRENKFIAYLRELRGDDFFLYEGSLNQDEFYKLKQQNYSYLLVRVRNQPDDFLLHKADYVVNFSKLSPKHINLLENATQWQIEHAVRVITNKTIGIALSSGGPRGMAHLAVLKVLQKEQIPLDYIVGTSAGAFYGGGYAFGCSMDDMGTLILNESKKILLRALRNFSFSFSGLIRTEYYYHLFKSIFGDKLMSDANIPFAAIASDLCSGKSVILTEGKAVDAILASNSIPVYMRPLRIDHQLLIDGVSTDPLGIQELIDKNIKIKIAVPIPQLESITEMKKNPSLLSVFLRSRSMLAEKMVILSASLADVIIAPQILTNKRSNWNGIQSYLEAGENAANLAIKRIKYLLNK